MSEAKVSVHESTLFVVVEELLVPAWAGRMQVFMWWLSTGHQDTRMHSWVLIQKVVQVLMEGVHPKETT